MKVAVTGGTGFLGRHVVRALQNSGIEPLLLVRPGRPPQAHQLEVDFANPPQDLFARMGRPEVLIHLAWGGLPNYQSLHHFETELPLQFRFLKQLIESGLGHLVVSGTCSEYGMQSGPLAEDQSAEPVHAYSLAKNALRQQLQCLCRQSPFQLTWARVFYPYGEGQAANSVLSQLKAACQAGLAEFNMSAGEQLRDFLPVEQVAQTLVRLASQRQHHGVVNLGSGSPTSVRRLVEDWLQREQQSIRLNLGYYPYPNYEPMAFWADTRKLMRCLEGL